MSLLSEKDPRSITLKPVVSEKSYNLIDHGQYTFLVDSRSNETEIKQAIEAIFKVRAASISTQNREGKRVHTRTGQGKYKDTRRTIVTLGEDSIGVFEQQTQGKVTSRDS